MFVIRRTCHSHLLRLFLNCCLDQTYFKISSIFLIFINHYSFFCVKSDNAHSRAGLISRVLVSRAGLFLKTWKPLSMLSCPLSQEQRS